MKFDRLSEQELEQVLQVMRICSQFGPQFNEKMNLIKKLAPEASEDMNYIFELHCLFNAGRVFGRMEKALEMDPDAMPTGTSTGSLMEILNANRNESGQTLADALFEHVSEVTEEAFRYGYYAALDSEEVCDCHHERESEEDNMFAILCDADKRKRLIERNGNTVGLSLTLQSAYAYAEKRSSLRQ